MKKPEKDNTAIRTMIDLEFWVGKMIDRVGDKIGRRLAKRGKRGIS